MRARLERALALQQEGRLAEAGRLYAEVVRDDPKNADALQMLGLLARRAGRPDEALALLDRAVAADPDHAPAQANRAGLLLALGRPADAEAGYTRALSLRPGLLEAALGRARALVALKDPRAEAAFKDALARWPDHAGLQAAHGAWLLDQGRVLPAIGALRRAGDHPGARVRLGAALRLAGRPAEAVPVLREAVTRDTADADARRELGLALAALGRPTDAEPLLASVPQDPVAAGALGALRLAAGRPADAVAPLRIAAIADPARLLDLADALHALAEPPGDVGDALLAALASPDVDAQRVERAARAALALQPAVSAWLADPGHPDVDALAGLPLLDALLRRTIVTHPRWERALIGLRDALVDRAVANEPVPLPLVESLAVQAWHTEYAWPTRAAALPPGCPAAALLGPDDAGLPALRRLLVDEPADEARRAFPVLGAARDAAAGAVRAQYEAHPYPRRVAVHRRPPAPLADVLAATLPAPPPTPPGLRVLVAGCGTGQHPLSIATRWAGADVLAVDLSRASLARAARHAEALGVTHLRFAQADLSALPDELTFDVIDCVGVLHHLADPLAGGHALVARLVPGGLLRLGLYSERGRTEIPAARALAGGLLTTDADLRAFRARALDLPDDHPARPLVWSPDFYSLSGLRDLAFHACEHRYTPVQVGALVAALGLELHGVQPGRGDARALYAARWPQDGAQADLARWDALEQEHPRLFSGMIQVWCRKPTASA